MPIQISSTGLAGSENTFPQFLLTFLDSVLRGIGQVMVRSRAACATAFAGSFVGPTFEWLFVLASPLFPRVRPVAGTGG